MVEEIQSIRSTIDDLRDSAEDMERALNAVVDDENRLMSRVSWLEEENANLREMLQRTWDAFHDATAREFVMVKNELRELGVVVDG